MGSEYATILRVVTLIEFKESVKRPNSLQGLYLTGAAYEGIGIPDCIRDGARVGKEVVHSFS